eukprot:scpid17881/ scgid21289/ 
MSHLLNLMALWARCRMVMCRCQWCASQRCKLWYSCDAPSSSVISSALVRMAAFCICPSLCGVSLESISNWIILLGQVDCHTCILAVQLCLIMLLVVSVNSHCVLDVSVMWAIPVLSP